MRLYLLQFYKINIRNQCKKRKTKFIIETQFYNYSNSINFIFILWINEYYHHFINFQGIKFVTNSDQYKDQVVFVPIKIRCQVKLEIISILIPFWDKNSIKNRVQVDTQIISSIHPFLGWEINKEPSLARYRYYIEYISQNRE
jgi:hypothetical protein